QRTPERGDAKGRGAVQPEPASRIGRETVRADQDLSGTFRRADAGDRRDRAPHGISGPPVWTAARVSHAAFAVVGLVRIDAFLPDPVGRAGQDLRADEDRS